MGCLCSCLRPGYKELDDGEFHNVLGIINITFSKILTLNMIII